MENLNLNSQSIGVAGLAGILTSGSTTSTAVPTIGAWQVNTPYPAQQQAGINTQGWSFVPPISTRIITPLGYNQNTNGMDTIIKKVISVIVHKSDLAITSPTEYDLFFCLEDHKYYEARYLEPELSPMPTIGFREVTINPLGNVDAVPEKLTPKVEIELSKNESELFDAFASNLHLPKPTVKSVSELPTEDEARIAFNKAIIDQRLAVQQQQLKIEEEIVAANKRFNTLRKSTIGANFHLTTTDLIEARNVAGDIRKGLIEKKKHDTNNISPWKRFWAKVKQDWRMFRNQHKLAGTAFE